MGINQLSVNCEKHIDKTIVWNVSFYFIHSQEESAFSQNQDSLNTHKNRFLKNNSHNNHKKLLTVVTIVVVIIFIIISLSFTPLSRPVYYCLPATPHLHAPRLTRTGLAHATNIPERHLNFPKHSSHLFRYNLQQVNVNEALCNTS